MLCPHLGMSSIGGATVIGILYYYYVSFLPYIARSLINLEADIFIVTLNRRLRQVFSWLSFF